MVGRHFQTLLTTTDYFANSILWLPYVVWMIWSWGEWSKLRAPLPKKRNWKNWREWIWPIFIALFFGCYSLVLTWPPGFFHVLMIMGVTVFVWARVWEKFYRPFVWLGEDLRPIVRELVLTGPPVLFIVFFWGLANAASDLERSEDTYIIRLKNSEYSEAKIFLRSFDKGILLKDRTSDFIEFHKWDEVLNIERLVPPKSSTFMCYLFEWCPPKKELPPLP